MKKSIKKFICVVLSVLMFSGVLSFSTTTIHAAGLEHETAIPEGFTAIYSAEDLNNVRNNLAGSYILMNDIDLSSWGNWVPIGDGLHSFTGIFDGNGYAIKKMKIDIICDDEFTYIGLFGYLDKATIKNLCIVESNVIVEHIEKSFGVVAGQLVGLAASSVIQDCHIMTGKISIEESMISEGSKNVSTPKDGIPFDIGGLAGCIGICTVSNCYNGGDLNVCFGCIGGLIGNASRSNIESCYNSGDIISNRAGYGKIGGLIGYEATGSGIFKSSIINCYNAGDVNVAFGSSAGLIGTLGYNYQCNSSIEVKNCYNVGRTGANSWGLIGYDNSKEEYYDSFNNEYCHLSVTIENCYYKNDVSEAIGQSGTMTTINNVKSLTDDEMQQQTSFTGFDFANVWSIDNTLSYPYPQLLSNLHVQQIVQIIRDNKRLSEKLEVKAPWYRSYKSTKNDIQLGSATNLGTDVTAVWSSDNPSKVQVDQTGKIKNLKTGARTANITVNLVDSENNVIATDSLKVIFYKYNWQLKKLQTQSFVSDNYAQRNMSAQEFEESGNTEPAISINSTEQMQKIVNMISYIVSLLRKIAIK